MTPTDAARIAEACDLPAAAACHLTEEHRKQLAEAARFFRTLASSPADSAEDAAGVENLRVSQHQSQR